MARDLPLRILLAEDNPVNQQVLLSMLQRLGYQAEVAGDGLEALAALQRQPYDVVLLDVQMPMMDGLEVARRVHAEWPPDRRPRLIAVTASAMPRDRESCLAAGMDDYLSKPLKLEELRQALSRCRPSPQTAETAPEKAADSAGSGVTQGALRAAEAADPLDHTVLDELHSPGDGDAGRRTVAGFIRLYLENAAVLLGDMETALRQRDSQTLERLAHTLRSSSGTLGAWRVSALCKELEQALRAQSDQTDTATVLPWADFVRQVAQIQAESERVQSPLQALAETWESG